MRIAVQVDKIQQPFGARTCSAFQKDVIRLDAAQPEKPGTGNRDGALFQGR